MRNSTAWVSMAACLAVGIGMGYALTLHTQNDSRLERNKVSVRRIHQEVWSNPEAKAAGEAVDRFFAPDFVRHGWRGVTHGLPEFKNALARWRAAFPDWSEHVEDIVAEGNFVATRITTDGTQRGDLAAIPGLSPAIPARGRQLRMTELNLWRIENGKVSEQWDIYDNWGAWMQLGFIDPDRVCSVQAVK
jgi:predicted ester cyclase